MESYQDEIFRSSFIRIVLCIDSSLFFMAEYFSTVGTDHV